MKVFFFNVKENEFLDNKFWSNSNFKMFIFFFVDIIFYSYVFKFVMFYGKE